MQDLGVQLPNISSWIIDIPTWKGHDNIVDRVIREVFIGELLDFL
jgi:hypothetical protein